MAVCFRSGGAHAALVEALERLYAGRLGELAEILALFPAVRAHARPDV
jgi:hypothetical protein